MNNDTEINNRTNLHSFITTEGNLLDLMNVPKNFFISKLCLTLLSTTKMTETPKNKGYYYAKIRNLL